MGILVRLFMMALAYLLACAAASIVLTLGTLSPYWKEIVPPDLPAAAFWVVAGIGAVVIAALALPGALLVLALAEGLAWRSVVLYGVLGGLLALLLAYGIDFAGHAGAADGIATREREVLAASGIAGGLVYWIVAGRNAGSWKS
jgi:hypothetical protein